MKKKRILAVFAAAALTAAPVWIIFSAAESGGESAYRETEAVTGSLAVGISKSGAVDIGTSDQTFDLDISELVRNTSAGTSGYEGAFGTGSGNMQESFDMFSQIFGMAADRGGSVTAGSGDGLKVAETLVTVGQRVAKGDVLYRLDGESVSKIRERLQSDVEKAEADLDLVHASQKASRQTAMHNYDTSVAYGEYAQTEYDAAVASLEETVSDREKSLKAAEEELALYEERLARAREEYNTAAEMLERAAWSADNTDKWAATYLYVEYENLKAQAKATADSLKKEIAQLEETIEKAGQDILTLRGELAAALRELELGKLSAGETRDLRNLAGKTARETYDIAVSYLDMDAAGQEEICASARERYEAFGTWISGDAVLAQGDGVVTDVCLEAGDFLCTGDTLVTVYDLENVTVTVDVKEEDMDDIQVGSPANVAFTAYPDQVFTAVVTGISDAETDSDGTVGYAVTAALTGDVTGLYQGMTGNIAFITKEKEEVLYISNRAVMRKDGKSYVKVKDGGGTVDTVEVKTGFSDGVNVEILEGLSEGDTVLIESKVKNG